MVKLMVDLGKMFSRKKEEKISPYEEAFVRKLEKKSERFFRIGNFMKEEDYSKLSGAFYSELRAISHNLKTFLDHYGAKENKKFVFFRELVASTRWLAKAITPMMHIEKRYDSYNLGDKEKEKREFFYDLEKNLKFYDESIRLLYKETEKEAKNFFNITRKKIEERGFLDEPITSKLPYNIELTETEKEEIENVLVDCIRIGHSLEEFLEKKEIKEEKIDKFVTSCHDLQTRYDTYITDTFMEKDDKRFSRLRGKISISLHLFETATDLVHFYERHESSIRHDETRERISKLINSSDVMNSIENFNLKYATKYIFRMKNIASDLLRDHAGIAREKLRIPVGADGIHLRPATLIKKIVEKHGGNVFFEVGNKKYNASDILETLDAVGHVLEIKDMQTDISVSLNTITESIKKENPEVVIDGKKYDSGLITKILDGLKNSLKKDENIRMIDIIVQGNKNAVDDIHNLALCGFGKYGFPPAIKDLEEILTGRR